MGSFYPGKGVEIVIEMARNCSNFDFTIVGGNQTDFTYWKNQTNEISNLNLLGFMSPQEIQKLQERFDVLLAPYGKIVKTASKIGNISQWMSPLKIFEYMASGRAIICSDLQVLREVLEHEKTALLCEPGNVDSWTKAVKRLNDDKNLRNELGKNAKKVFGRKVYMENASKISTYTITLNSIAL